MLTQIDYNSELRTLSRLRAIKQAQRVAFRTGGIAKTTATLLAHANIAVGVDGDLSAFTGGRGVLLVGDHRNGLECFPLLSVFGALGREDAYFIAKPFAISMRIIRTIMSANDVLLPVIPRSLAKERRDIWNRDLRWRVTQATQLPSYQELATLNNATLHRTADLLRAGSIVTLFPTGGVMEASTRPWQRGLGTIIKLLSAEELKQINIIFFQFDKFSSARFLTSLLVQPFNITPKGLSLTLKLGPQGTIFDLLGENAPLAYLTDGEITERLRRQFNQHFYRHSSN